MTGIVSDKMRVTGTQPYTVELGLGVESTDELIHPACELKACMMKAGGQEQCQTGVGM